MFYCRLMIGAITLCLCATTATAQPARRAQPQASRIEIVLPTRHTQDITSLAISRGGEDRFVASSGDDGVVKLWDIKSGRLIKKDSKTIKLFDGGTGKELSTLGDTVAVSLSPDGKRALAGRTSKQVELWDAQSGARTSTLTTLDATLKSAEHSANGRRALFKS